MKYLKPALLVTLVSLTTGCTSVKNWLTDTPNVKNTKQSTDTLVVPESLNTPVKSTEFHLVKGSKQANKSETVTSPSSVLEILQGSWVNTDDDNPYKIMLEKPTQVENFEQFINNGIEGLINSREYKLISNGDNYRVEVTKKTEVGFWFWKREVETERFVFEINYKVLPHGRSGEAFITPIELEKLSDTYAPKFSNEYRTQQLSIEMLNQLSLELDYQYRVVIQKQQVLTDVSLVMGTNPAGDHVITSQRDILFVFKKLEDIFEDLGFDIEEEDKKLFLYTLNYDKDDKSFFGSLFGSEYRNLLSLEAGEYEAVLVTTIDGVYIQFTNEEGQPLSQSQVLEIYNLIIKIIKEEEVEL
ncbi:outer membrane protein assembly factor BamC [Psychrosphaera haliotis]|uniref:outer membrane protein assembly factor BamC n=1 Tax=Psychrosphaera haliotis TaxID=555083 RepID=UPI0018C45DAE